MNTPIAVSLSIFTSIMLSGCAPERAESSSAKGSIIAYGLCVADGEENFYEHTESTAGYGSTTDLSITKQTLSIPLQKDITFGYRWQAENLPENAEITYAISHPEITKPDGTRISSFSETMTLQSENGKLESTDCYTLSEDHELVAGDWTIAVRHNNKLLATKTFNVVRN